MPKKGDVFMLCVGGSRTTGKITTVRRLTTQQRRAAAKLRLSETDPLPTHEITFIVLG